ncbi:YveK family protein [Lentibacillus sp. Marseille-P4043]|uniref:YveK family protein n=1 Tax=Lentibacillus sp. Marseille-P4043 TaxID=2040293 RepID=UPI000D0BBC9C|nr:Wzz/FepE/Etk N-terminal domain-containing protein [Lentibacillus sp. Marseille-P4043]
MIKVKQDNLTKYAKAKDINLKEYYLVIKKRIWIIIVITILTTLAGYYYSNMNNTPVYQTSTRIIIGSDSEYMKTLMVMIKDPIIMENVRNELKTDRSSEQIAEQIMVERIDESQVVKISVTDGSPEMAVKIANATAEIFKREIVKILDFKDVQLLSEAKMNPNPINGSQNRTIIIAFIFGMIVGVGLVFLLDSLDGAIQRDSEVEDILGVPVLGTISNMTRKKVVSKKVKRRRQVLEPGGEAIDIKEKKAEGYY